MKALVLWGETHSTNLGVQALGQGTAALAERVWPGVDVRFQGYGPGDAPTRIASTRLLAKQRVMRHSDLRDWVKTFDVALDTRGGDSFADIYGLERLSAMSAVAEFIREMHVPHVMTPQTIGPFQSPRGRLVGRLSLRRATTVMARDSASADYARSLGRPVDVLATDVVFALPVPEVARTRDILFNVSGLLWQSNPHVDSTAYRDIVLRLARALTASGRRVSLLAHVLDSDLPDNDVPALRELVKELDDDLELIIPSSLSDVREVIAGSELVIGSRMHACLNALSVGVPAVPLAYSRKFEPLLSDLNWSHTVDLRRGVDQVEQVLRLIDGDLRAGVAETLALTTDRLEAAAAGLGRSV
jgi:polysaccharide pyruvyl transferase WcaK-like protein